VGKEEIGKKMEWEIKLQENTTLALLSLIIFFSAEIHIDLKKKVIKGRNIAVAIKIAVLIYLQIHRELTCRGLNGSPRRGY